MFEDFRMSGTNLNVPRSFKSFVTNATPLRV